MPAETKEQNLGSGKFLNSPPLLLSIKMLHRLIIKYIIFLKKSKIIETK